MASTDFYDELDLRYPEIAICLDKIDRTNPGTKNFYIPVLTPNLDTTSLKTSTSTVYQNNANLENQNKFAIGNVQIQNYIPITIPRELCAYVGGDFENKNVTSLSVKSSGKITISGYTGGSGGEVHSHQTLAGVGSLSFNGSESIFEGTINTIPVDSDRFIPAGSKWIVVFIGGDIGKPQIIGRYTDPE